MGASAELNPARTLDDLTGSEAWRISSLLATLQAEPASQPALELALAALTNQLFLSGCPAAAGSPFHPEGLCTLLHSHVNQACGRSGIEVCPAAGNSVSDF